MHTVCTNVGDVFVAVHDAQPPTDADWNATIRHYRKFKPQIRCGLIVSEGGGPTAPQRKALAGEEASDKVPRAVVTSSAVTRGIVTAMRWIGQDIRAFSPDELVGAFRFLGIPDEQQKAVLDTVANLFDELRAGTSEVDTPGRAATTAHLATAPERLARMDPRKLALTSDSAARVAVVPSAPTLHPGPCGPPLPSC